MGTVEQDLRRYQQQIDEEDELDAATEEELTDPFAQRECDKVKVRKEVSK